MFYRLRQLIHSEAGYIDLGTGGYIIQIALAFLFGGLATVAIWWKHLVARFKGSKSNGDELSKGNK